MKKMYNFRKTVANVSRHARSLSLLLVMGLLFVPSAFSQVVNNSESFDGATFVPTGWTNFLTSGTNTWTRVTAGTSPTCTPHSGAGMAKFNSFSASGGIRSLITPVIDLSGRGATATSVSFWMYRDNNATYASTADKIDVLYNTAANVTGATLLGTVNRSMTLAPVVGAAGWYQYTFAVPAGFTGTTNYLIIRGTSAYGYNIFVDDVAWQSFLLACTGTPAPGNTLSSLNPVCSGASFMLSLQNATTGSGVTYQWQSSADGITYANIGGATLATYSTTQTSATFYQCIVTCTVSGLASTSTFINVPMNPFYLCSCTAIPSSTADEEITNVTVGSLNNSSTCATVAPGPGSIATRYGNYMSGVGAPAAPSIVRSSPTSVSVTVGSCGSFNYTSGLAIFMDLNHNASFADAGEKVYSSGASASINNIPATVVPISITIPGTATLGVTAMRVISDESTSGDAITPCIVFTYGETEDYLVNIVDLPPTPPTPTQSVAVPSCSSGTDLSVAGSPAVGDAWYWQTTALGTSLSTPVSGPYTVFVNGIYYVRAYNATYSVWSAVSSSITVSNIPVAPLPPTPTAVTPACLSTSLSVPAASGSVTFYWQGTTAGGTSASLDAASPYIAATSGTYYVAAYDASTSCWSNTNGLAVVIDTYVPATPTTTTSSLIICQGSASAIINAGAPSAASLTATFGTGLISPGTATNFNITVPAIPAGATITSTQLQIIGANAINGSWRSEIRVALSGSTTLTATQISALSSGGLITPDPSITVPNLPLAGGPVTLTLSESYDDGGVDDASFTEIKLVIAYTLPASTITWWNAATVGTQVGTGSPFETVGTTLLPTTATPGTYTFYAQAASGACLSSPRLAIPIIVNPVLITINPINVLCNGGSDGSFSLGTVTCGVGPFTYSVNGGAFGVIPTNLTAGTYTIIAKDSNGDNSSSISLTVTEPSWTVPNAVAGGPFSICQNAASEIISVTPGTVAIPQTVTVQFALAAQPADGAYPGALIASATMPALPAGAVVTSATLYAPGISTNSGSYETEFQLGLTGSVNSAAASGTGAIFGGGIFNYTRPVLPSEVNISGGALDLLYYESYDDYAGAADANFTLGASSVTLTITYTPGTSITWFDASTGGTSLGTGSTLETVGTSVLPTTATPGTYNFYAEGGYSGCTSPARTLVTVTVNALPVVTASSSAAAVCSGTAVTLNGGGALTYVWDNSVTDAIAFTPSATTTYNVVGTDGNGCTNTASAIVTVNDLPIVAATSTPVLCNGGSSTITVTATSGSPAYVGEGSFTQLAGTVVYTVTDANSCAGTTSVSVTEPTAIVTSSSSTAILCNAGTSTVTISATGGTGSFTGTGIFTQAAGTIVYTVTDANSCPSTTSVAVTEPTAIVLSSSETGVLCFGGTSAVTISATGGTGAYTGTGTFPQSAGTITYNVTDANACPASLAVVVAEPTLLSASSTTTGILCFGGSATVTVSASGGTAPYTGEGSFVQAPGTVVYNISDANGCTTSVSASETEPSEMFLGSGATSILCNGGASTITISAIGGTGLYTGTGTFSQLAGTTNYIVTDANGCSANTDVTVTEPSAIIPSSSFTTILCSGGTSTVTLSATGGTGALAGTGIFTQTAGTTNYVVTDANGCSVNTDVIITEPSAIIPSSTYTAILCNGGTSTVTVTATGGTGTLTGTGIFTQPAGTVVYTVTDANSCTATTSPVITEPAVIATTQTVNLCSGQTVTIGTNTYSTPGTYTDIMPAFNTCDSTVTTTVTTTTIDVSTVSAGLLITANSLTGTFQWLDCNLGSAPIATETNQSYTAAGSGDFAVQITDNGCVDTSACVNINATGINNNSFQNNLSVSPNPTNGVFNITINNANYSELLISIFDLQGKEVFSSTDLNVNGNYNKQINLEDLSKGVYYIKFNGGSQIKIQKLIIQ